MNSRRPFFFFCSPLFCPAAGAGIETCSPDVRTHTYTQTHARIYIHTYYTPFFRVSIEMHVGKPRVCELHLKKKSGVPFNVFIIFIFIIINTNVSSFHTHAVSRHITVNNMTARVAHRYLVTHSYV